MKRIKILIDNAYGIGHRGKVSPDGRLEEFSWTRRCAVLIVEDLLRRGIDAEQVVPENADISIGERVSRINSWCDRVGSDNVLLISVHNNTGSEDTLETLIEKDEYGWWKSCSGFEAYVGESASVKSRTMACLLTAEAEKHGVIGNRNIPSRKFCRDNIELLGRCKCPSVLTKNLFIDNKEDVEYLLSDKGLEDLARIHVDAILQYIG